MCNSIVYLKPEISLHFKKKIKCLQKKLLLEFQLDANNVTNECIAKYNQMCSSTVENKVDNPKALIIKEFNQKLARAGTDLMHKSIIGGENIDDAKLIEGIKQISLDCTNDFTKAITQVQ